MGFIRYSKRYLWWTDIGPLKKNGKWRDKLLKLRIARRCNNQENQG